MSKNYINEVGKLLGVEVGEVFQVDNQPSLEGTNFKFSEGFLHLSVKTKDGDNWVVADDSRLLGLLYGTLSIRKIPWKPKDGETYYIPAIGGEFGYYTVYWFGGNGDKLRYRRGLVFRTKEEAIAMTKKLLAVVKEKRENG